MSFSSTNIFLLSSPGSLLVYIILLAVLLIIVVAIVIIGIMRARRGRPAASGPQENMPKGPLAERLDHEAARRDEIERRDVARNAETGSTLESNAPERSSSRENRR